MDFEVAWDLFQALRFKHPEMGLTSLDRRKYGEFFCGSFGEKRGVEREMISNFPHFLEPETSGECKGIFASFGRGPRA